MFKGYPPLQKSQLTLAHLRGLIFQTDFVETSDWRRVFLDGFAPLKDKLEPHDLAPLKDNLAPLKTRPAPSH